MVEREICGEKALKIYEFENRMLYRFIKIAEPYSKLLKSKGYDLLIELGRINTVHNIWSNNSLPLTNGYECYIYGMIIKNGEIVRIVSKDGEADYYELITSWMVSAVWRKFLKLQVFKFTETDSISNDIEEMIKHLFEHKL